MTAASSSLAATTAGAEALERLQTWPGEHRVAVGLSGGVDSSLTAALLVEAGWDVEGVTLWLMSGKGACCAEGLVDAAGICEQLGVPHHVVDSRDTFVREIVDGLIEGYQAGITPLPLFPLQSGGEVRPHARLGTPGTGTETRGHRPLRPDPAG